MNHWMNNNNFESNSHGVITLVGSHGMGLEFMGGNFKNYTKLGKQYGVSHGICYSIIDLFIKAMLLLHSDVIVWPNATQKTILKALHTEQHEMKGLIGFIDGTHIPIINYAFNEQKIDFTNRKSFYSINLTVVVDQNERVIAANYGQPGREGDSTVYRLMDIYCNSTLYSDDGEYLFGDKAYPLSKTLITPFKGISRDGISGKSFFNYKHASVRSVVERAIGRIKARWAILNIIHVRSKEKADSKQQLLPKNLQPNVLSWLYH